MTYAKLKNNTLQRAPKRLHIGNQIVYNPTPEMLEAAGYLPVVYIDPPECDESHYPVAEYAEQDGRIVQVWRVEDNTI